MRLRISNLFQLGAILALCSTLLLAAPRPPGSCE